MAGRTTVEFYDERWEVQEVNSGKSWGIPELKEVWG